MIKGLPLGCDNNRLYSGIRYLKFIQGFYTFLHSLSLKKQIVDYSL